MEKLVAGKWILECGILIMEIFCMVSLREVTEENFYDCMALKREESLFVGGAEYVLAEAYLYRESSLAYAIYLNDTVIGLVILDEQGVDRVYEFTDLFIADDYRNQGFGKEALQAIICHFTEKNAVSIKMQVHKSNEIALHLYQANGFTVKEISPGDRDFVIMEKKL